MAELTYEMTSSPLATRGVYYPLRFSIGPPANDRVRATAAEILAAYYGERQSFTRWRAAGWLVFRWQQNQISQISRPFRFESICASLSDHSAFSTARFNLPALVSAWLDASVAIAPKFHAPANERPDEALTFQVPTAISDEFPIRPQLDREGIALSSLQLMLLNSWLELRTKLVEASHRMFDDRNDWLRDLFAYFSTVVAAVDNTLHQIYYRAKYEAPRHGWSFDENKLGSTHGRRMQDKLHWIGQITGRPLNCPSAVRDFMRIKAVRNHLAHFDPPALAFSIEDVAEWLNASHGVARMLAEIRNIVGQPVCTPLVALLVAKSVDWYAWDPGRRRVPQGEHVGYASSVKPRNGPPAA